MSDINLSLKTSSVLWNLKDLYEDTNSVQLKDDCLLCEEKAISLQNNYKEKIERLTSSELLQLVTELEELHTLLGKINTFAYLNYATQVDNSIAGHLYQEVSELTSRCEKEIIFFELEWNQLPEKIVKSFFQNSELDHYKHYLLSLRRYRPHQLSEIEEQLLFDLQPIGRKSWNTLFQKVISGIRFGDKKRSQEEVLTDLYSDDRNIRKTAAQDMTQGLQENSHILTHVFNTQAADKMIQDRLRGYSTWVDAMNLDNQLTGETVDTLVESVMSRYDIVKRYYGVKKELLGLSEVLDYDRYAPLPHLSQQHVDWPTCKDIVLDSFAQFSIQLHDIADSFFTHNWIHAPVIQGKRGGAFAHPCVPGVHPYVMVNYTGSLRDISTVAHELGHGIHQTLASQLGYLNSDTPLVLAETASVFAELLVFNAQINLLKNPKDRQAFICQKLESIFATVFRQTAMNRFENMLHEGRRTEGELSATTIGQFWLQTQKEMFGDAVTLTEDYGVWWSYIPHFLSTPGYVYSYAFGELLVLALYGVYQEEGDVFVEKYINLLKAGGSATPYELVKPFGIDLNDPVFWQQGLKVIDSMLQEVESI